MGMHPIAVQNGATNTPRVALSPHPYRRSRYIGLLLIFCAVFVAGFAVTEIWRAQDRTLQGGDVVGESTVQNDALLPPMTEPPSFHIPDGATPIVVRDLSATEFGPFYINNATAYQPSLEALMERDVSSSITEAPLVLILHTHTSEGYVSNVTEYFEGDVGDVTYTKQEERNVLAVGKVLTKTLKEKGITALHCTVMHDQPSLGGSYKRAAESIRFFLEQYPSIRYVIDLHRDAVMTEKGEYVRAVAETSDGTVAQVMPVVGSDSGGTLCENWEGNLALALQLRSALNAEGASVCRPIYLRNSTYNQELAPFSLLLEIGTGGNCIEEAERAAVLVGEALAKLIYPY